MYHFEMSTREVLECQNDLTNEMVAMDELESWA